MKYKAGNVFQWLGAAVLSACLMTNAVADFYVCDTRTKAPLAAHAIVWTQLSLAEKEQIAATANYAHAGMIRMDLTWASLQYSANNYDWHWADESVKAAQDNNLEIVAIVTELPAWASQNPTSPDFRFYPPNAQSWTAWQNFVTAFVNRYGKRGFNSIHYWEIWGEPNESFMWKGTPAEYARLYSLACTAIKKSDPDATVLMGGINDHNQPQWINAVLNDPQYPAKNKIDVINVHIRSSVDLVKKLTVAWKNLFAQNGVTGKPFWITEFGFPSAPEFQQGWDDNYVGIDAADGEVKQDSYYQATVPWLLTDGGVNKLFITLRDLNEPSAWGSEGLINMTLTRAKPALLTIRRYQCAPPPG